MLSKCCQNFANISSNFSKIFIIFLHPSLSKSKCKKTQRKTTRKSEQKSENMKLRKGKQSPTPQRQPDVNNTTTPRNTEWGISQSHFPEYFEVVTVVIFWFFKLELFVKAVCAWRILKLSDRRNILRNGCWEIAKSEAMTAGHRLLLPQKVD